MRVYAKAKQLGITSRALLDYLAKNGCVLPSASCNLTPEALELIPEGALIDIARTLWFSPRPELLPPWPPWPQLVTGYQAAQIARVDPATIRQWVRRGHLVQADLRGHSKGALYALDAVLAARLHTRQRRRDKVPTYRVLKLRAENFDELVTVREAAQMMDIPESTIRSWARRRRLVAVGRRGRSPLYRLAALYRLIKDRTRPDLELPKRPTPDYWDDWH